MVFLIHLLFLALVHSYEVSTLIMVGRQDKI